MADSKNIMSQISLMTKVVCYFCNQEKSNLSTFSICSHKICNSCLYWRIFSNHINEFQGQAKLTIKCKCGKGYLYQKLTEILKILKEKKDSDESFLYKRRNNIKISFYNFLEFIRKAIDPFLETFHMFHFQIKIPNITFQTSN